MNVNKAKAAQGMDVRNANKSWLSSDVSKLSRDGLDGFIFIFNRLRVFVCTVSATLNRLLAHYVGRLTVVGIWSSKCALEPQRLSRLPRSAAKRDHLSRGASIRFAACWMSASGTGQQQPLLLGLRPRFDKRLIQ